MLASQRSVGRRITFEDRDYVVEERTTDSFNGVDIALFSVGGSISKKFGPAVVDRGIVVVDNSSAFRMDKKVPLVIPEVNPEAMQHIKVGTGKGALMDELRCHEWLSVPTRLPVVLVLLQWKSSSCKLVRFGLSFVYVVC